MSRSKNAVSSLFALLAIGAIISGASGKPPKPIFGGRMAPRSVFSAAVTLSRPGDFVHTCGAAIIGPRHILTAAHCVEDRTPDDICVHAGIHNIRDRQNVIERSVSKVIMHPAYLPYKAGVQDVQDDIAILVLERGLPIGGRIQMFELPPNQPRRDVSYVVAGWGQSSDAPVIYPTHLKTLTMKLGDENACRLFVPKTVCAFSDHGSPCFGDSGSPLAKDDYIYGIVSTVNCKDDEPTGFVNVYDYLDWIEYTMMQNP